MSDPRITLGADVSGADAQTVLRALDRVRPIVRVDPILGRFAATAAAALAVLLSRTFPHTSVEGDAAVGPNPWGGTSVADVLERTRAAIPTSSREAEIAIVIGVGHGVTEADLWIGGDDWTVRVARHPLVAEGNFSALGVHAAAALAAAEVTKEVLGKLGMITVPIEGEFVWNLIDYKLCPAVAPPFEGMSPQKIALLGCGSVGSSVAGALTCVEGLSGEAGCVDPDHFDPDRNPYRYPTATGAESGPKADWLAGLLGQFGWASYARTETVGAWVVGQPEPGFNGLAISSVDQLTGRLEVADVLARTTLSAGVKGLTLQVQREHPDDEFACPYCQFLDVSSPLSSAGLRAQQAGLSAQRVLELELRGELLTQADVDAAVQAGRVLADNATAMVGRRLDDLLRRVYAEIQVPTSGGAPAPPVSAAFVSWFVGVLLAAEIVKSALANPMIDRRCDVDLSGVPLGLLSRRERDRSGRCTCRQPGRIRWARRLYPS